MVNNTITKEKAWQLLDKIPDPDIPVISITELGIVRGVEVTEDGKTIVTITPSYSGCPAMDVFKTDIKTILENNGAKEVEIKVSHSPAWTTDWLSNAVKEKLKHYGIAPPENSCETVTRLFSDSRKPITCPHCNKKETQLLSQFGSTPCKALWYCNTCQQPFEYFKCY